MEEALYAWVNWVKRMFLIRYHAQGEPVEPTLVRFTVPEALLLMTIEGYREELVSAGDYTRMEVENPYGLDENWYIIVGTDLGAAKSCWEDFENVGLIRTIG